MAFPGTIPRMLARAASEWPDRPYLQVRVGEQVLSRTFAEVYEEVRGIAGGLLRLGIGRGEHVALLGHNSPEWVLHYLAIACAGATVVPLDSLMSSVEIANLVVQSKSRAIIVSEKFRDAVEPTALEHGIQVFSLDAPGRGVTRDSSVSFYEPAPSDVAVIIFTSGTTGFAKGVMLTHRNLCADIDGVLQAIQILPTDNFHLLLPLHHTYSGTVNMLVPLGGGARATFATSFKSRDIADDIRIAGITLLVGVPQVFENLMAGFSRVIEEATFARRTLFRLFYFKSAFWNRFGINLGPLLFRSLRKKAGMSSLRFMVSGGAALRPEINRYFQRLGFTVLQGYGLTEASPILSATRPHHIRIGSVGPAIPGVELRIDHPDPSGIGEICARGPNIMLGYYENPEATAHVIRDGWFHTGDSGYLDQSGNLWITGRVKNVIITGAGKNVHPEEIESVLNASPYILESLIIGVTRKRSSGEELCALLVADNAAIEAEKQQGREIDVNAECEALITEYNSSVAAYRRIRQWRIHPAEFEKTSTRKIKRFAYQSAFSGSKDP